MTAALYAKANGTQGALLVNGSEVVVFDSTGITSGVNKSSVSQMPTLSTAVNTTSGTSIDFTSIPSWVKRITVMLNGVSTNGTNRLLVQLGVSGTAVTTGYLAATSVLSTGVTTTASTAGFIIDIASASTVTHGSLVLTLQDSSNNRWVASGTLMHSDTARTVTTAGSISLAGSLNMIRLTSVGGTDTFDAGILNILYE